MPLWAKLQYLILSQRFPLVAVSASNKQELEAFADASETETAQRWLNRMMWPRGHEKMVTFGAALAVILANGVVFRDVDAIIYGLILNFLASTVINRMMFGFNSCMLAMIVTENGPAACEAIDREVDRGSTILKGYGGYKQDPRDVVLCACSSKQLYEIEKVIKRLDPGSFIIMLQANEIQGEGFRRLVLGKNEKKG